MQEKLLKTRVIYRAPLGHAKRKFRLDNLAIVSFRCLTDPIRRGLELVKEAGFDAVEFAWVDPEDSLKCMAACEEIGLDGVFQNWDIFGGMQDAHTRWEIDYPALEDYLAHGAKFRHVIGYYVWDEPQKLSTIDVAAQQVRELERLAPDKLPLTCALPSYGPVWRWDKGNYEEYLRYYADTVLDEYAFFPGLKDEEKINYQEPIFSYVGQQRNLFVNGTLDPNDDATWQNYLSELERLGLSRYLEIMQGVYDRKVAE